MIGEIIFFKRAGKKYRDLYSPGYFFYAPIPFFYPGVINSLALDYFDPDKPKNSNFRIEHINPSKLNQEIKPMPEIGVESGEVLIVIKHKIRLVVSISCKVPCLLGDKKSKGNSILCLPLYSTKDKGDNYKYSDEFINKIQAYQYPTLFLLPEDNALHVKESIIRLDKATFIPESYLNPIPLSLTQDALNYLSNWYHHLSFGELDETIVLYKELTEKNI